MIVNDMPTFSKEYAFKLALVNEFSRTTFAEFIFALRQRMDQPSKLAGKFIVHGIDCRNRKFIFNVESFNIEHDNTCMELRVYYKWEASEDRPSNWHWQTVVMTETSYIKYMRDADLVYKKENDIKTVDSDFEQWKEKNPLAYEVIFTLISYYGKKHGRPASSEMYFIKCNFKDRIIGNVISTDCAGLHCPKVNHFTINDFIVLSKKVRIKLNGLTYTNVLGRTIKIDYTHPASVIDVEYDIIQKISSDVDAAYDEKRRMAKETDCDDKPTYKKPGVTYQHVSTASNGSTETQMAIERMLKTSVCIDTDVPWATTNPDLNRKVMEYTESDAEAIATYYEALNKEKETIKMKKLIINHNAVIVLTGAKDSYGKEKKTVVNILDHDTKKERGQWNTKLAVVSAIAKSFEHSRDGKLSTCYKLYEMLNTIKKPTNATIDFVADEMYQNNKRLKCCKWYQEAIKVKRPAPGKSVVIIMEDK